MHKTAYVVEDEPENDEYMSSTTWMLVANKDSAFGEIPLDQAVLKAYKDARWISCVDGRLQQHHQILKR